MASRNMLGKLSALVVAPIEKGRGNNINFLRFLAATIVLCGHMSGFVGADAPELGNRAISVIALDTFFILSGYLICESLSRDANAFRYMVRRVFRIFPALMFVVLVSVFVIGPLMTTLGTAEYFAHTDTWLYLVHNCVLWPQYSLPGVFADNVYPGAVNGSLWTLPVEFSMYLLLPCVLFAARRVGVGRGGVALFTLVLAILSLLGAADVFSMGVVVWGTSLDSALTLAPYFFLGALFSLYPEIRQRLNMQVAFVAFMLLGLLQIDAPIVRELAMMVLLPYVVFSFSFAVPAVFGRVFAENDYSYGVYLWAFPVQQTLVALLGAGAFELPAYVVVAFVATLPCAMLSWFAVERPASRLGKRITAWSRARQAGDAPAH